MVVLNFDHCYKTYYYPHDSLSDNTFCMILLFLISLFYAISNFEMKIFQSANIKIKTVIKHERIIIANITVSAYSNSGNVFFVFRVKKREIEGIWYKVEE